MTSDARAAPQAADEYEYVEFWAAGRTAKGEFHCAECGYGVTIYRTLPTCPMCGSEAWEQAAWRPFGRSGAALPP
jgi:rubrerythrin